MSFAGINVKDIQVLEDLIQTLPRFKERGMEAERKVETVVRDTVEKLRSRVMYWHTEVTRLQTQLALMLQTQQQAMILQTQQELARAQQNLQTAMFWVGEVEKAISLFRREELNLHHLLGDVQPRASIFLQNKLSYLQEFISLGSHNENTTTNNNVQISGDTTFQGSQFTMTNENMYPEEYAKGNADFYKSLMEVASYLELIPGVEEGVLTYEVLFGRDLFNGDTISEEIRLAKFKKLMLDTVIDYSGVKIGETVEKLLVKDGGLYFVKEFGIIVDDISNHGKIVITNKEWGNIIKKTWTETLNKISDSKQDGKNNE